MCSTRNHFLLALLTWFGRAVLSCTIFKWSYLLSPQDTTQVFGPLPSQDGKTPTQSSLLVKLQLTQNAVECLHFKLPKFSHITSSLCSLQQISVAACSKSKTLMLAVKAKPAPTYTCQTCSVSLSLQDINTAQPSIPQVSPLILFSVLASL